MRALLLACLMTACGGATSSDAHPATPAPPPAPTTTPAPTAAATAPGDDLPDASPPPFGNRHDKIGNGFFLSGSGKAFYDAIYEPGGHPNILVRQKSDAGGRFVTLMKNVAAAPYAGKKIRVRLQVESKGVSGRGEVWGRAQPPRSPDDAPTVTTKIDAASTDMKVYAVILDVKDNVRVIEYGVSLAGPGEVRVGKDAIDVVP